jgi:DNA adenine methylase
MTSDEFARPIEPTRTAAAYIGGKKQLSKRLVSLLNATQHATYAEAFVGMGGVFLKRTLQPKAEVINDYSGDVATFSASCSGTIRSSWTRCGFRSGVSR